jgi:frataxin-like iron-binding protein CyaY
MYLRDYNHTAGGYSMDKKKLKQKVCRQVNWLIYFFVPLCTIFSFSLITFGNNKLQDGEQFVNLPVYVKIEETTNYALLKNILFGIICLTSIFFYWNYHQKKMNQKIKQLTEMLQKTQKRYDELAEQSKKIQEEINGRASFQKIIADLSKNFINISTENIDETLIKMLKTVGQFFRADHSSIYRYSEEKGYYKNTHEWCENNISSLMVQLPHIVSNDYPWWSEQLKKNKPFYFFDSDALPLNAVREKQEFKRLNIQSLICIPIFITENNICFLGLDFVQEKKYLSAEDIDFLVIIANILTDGLRKYEIEKNLILTKEQLELAFYQAQIGPHFLYNTLSTIAIFCDSDPQLASKLVLDLSLYLRRSFDFKNLNTFVSLEKEIELVQAYINIEKARFGKRLKVIYDIDLDSKKTLIPPLIIQPLVENAIRHGLMKRIAGGTLKIKVKSLRNKCIIQVIDNGIGIEKSIIDQLYSNKYCPSSCNLENSGVKTGIGLRNIHIRLRKIYNCGLIIKSSHSYGTKISLSIPIHQKGSE